MTGPVKIESHDIVHIVSEMEGCLIDVSSYTATLGGLIQYVEDHLSPEHQDLRSVMYRVQEDLERAVVVARKHWDNLNEATTGAAREKTDA